METFIYKGRLELYNGKTRRFEFDSQQRLDDRWLVVEYAVKNTPKIKMDDVMDLEFFSITTDHSSLIDE